MGNNQLITDINLNSLDAVHVCMQIHTLNRYRFYMHSVSKKNVLVTKISLCMQMLAALVTLIVHATCLVTVMSSQRTHYSRLH